MSHTLTITVHLHTVLRRGSSLGALVVQVPAGCTLDELRRRLEIAYDPAELLLVVNGRAAQVSQVLADGDEVHFIPAISGGGRQVEGSSHGCPTAR